MVSFLHWSILELQKTVAISKAASENSNIVSCCHERKRHQNLIAGMKRCLQWLCHLSTFFKCWCFNKLTAQLRYTLGTKSPIQRGQPLDCLDVTQDFWVHRENLTAKPAKAIPVAQITGEFPTVRAQRLDFGKNTRNNFHRVLSSGWTWPGLGNSELITRSAQWRKRQFSERFTVSSLCHLERKLKHDIDLEQICHFGTEVSVILIFSGRRWLNGRAEKLPTEVVRKFAG